MWKEIDFESGDSSRKEESVVRVGRLYTPTDGATKDKSKSVDQRL
jgi:hypothetical protein